MPVPIGAPSLHFVPWSFGQMRPLAVVPGSITVNNVLQSFLDVFIPANTWADFKRLIIWADVVYTQNGGPHPGGRILGEAQSIQGLGNIARGGPQPIANSANPTRYVIQRQYQLQAGGIVDENNWDIQGNTGIGAAANATHRIAISGFITPFDQTQDAYLKLLIGNTFAGSTDTMFVHTAQAYIQAPYDLNRLPR